MSQSRKHRGYATEKLVAQFFSQWWPHALPTGAGRVGSDVTGIPYFDIEVKARASFQPKAWIDQVRKRTEQNGDIPVVVSRLNGQGMDVGNYLAFMRLSDLVNLMRKAGYGNFDHVLTDSDIVRCKGSGEWIVAGQCKLCEEQDANI
jgi:hypothetical protein